jgi:hypothetical protein
MPAYVSIIKTPATDLQLKVLKPMRLVLLSTRLATPSNQVVTVCSCF